VDVSRLEQDLSEHRSETTTVKHRWIEPVKELIGRINRNFSAYFAAMKCAGEVDISVPDNPVCTPAWFNILSYLNYFVKL